jgi:hypothetical protein
MTEELAYIQGDAFAIRNIVMKSAVAGSGSPLYDDIYLSVTDGLVESVVGLQGNIVLTYCSYYSDTAGYSDFSVETGEKCQAIINVPDFINYLDFATSEEDSEIRVSFRGDPDDELAKTMEITGALNTRVRLPAGESVLDEIPLGVTEKFDDDQRFLTADGSEMPVTIQTRKSVMEKLIEVVDYDPDTNFYPISVAENDDEMQFELSVGGDSGSNEVWGELDASLVASPDEFTNEYDKGFSEVFSSFDPGEVELQTATKDAPIAIVRETDGYTLRHLVGVAG